MNSKPQLLEGFTASVDKVIYTPELEAPEDRPHPFVYFITIHNESDVALVVRGRKWIVREEDGQVMVLEGEGVVGCFPELAPGEHFSYNSYHVTAGDAVAEGSYLAVTEKGEAVIAKIPGFELNIDL